MPNTKSAEKRLRQNTVHRDRNRAVKSALRTQIRKVHEAIKAGQVEQAEELFRTVARHLDRAGARRIIHPNKAARLKSRLVKRIKAVKAA